MSKKNSKLCGYRFTNETITQIQELAQEKGVSQTQIIEMAVHNLYSQDTFDENIVLARMTTIEKQFSYLDKKCDTFFRFIHFILPNLFSRLAPLPHDKTERGLVLDNGSNIIYNLIMLFRKDEKKNHLSYMQSVYGDTQEDLKSDSNAENEGDA